MGNFNVHLKMVHGEEENLAISGQIPARNEGNQGNASTNSDNSDQVQGNPDSTNS